MGSAVRAMYDFQGIDEELLQRMVYDALVWSSLHGLVVGDRTVKVSGERSVFVVWIRTLCFCIELRKKIGKFYFLLPLFVFR